MRSGIRIRVSRDLLRSVVAWAAMLGCAVLLAVALAGCGPTDHQERAMNVCIESGGIPELIFGDYASCRLPPPSPCPPCPCETPAEAPEGGAP